MSDVGRLGREHPQRWFGETFCLQMSRDDRNTFNEAKQEQSCSSNGVTLTFSGELEGGFAPIPLLALHICSHPKVFLTLEAGACKKRSEMRAGNRMCRFCFNNELQIVTLASPLAAYFVQCLHILFSVFMEKIRSLNEKTFHHR